MLILYLLGVSLEAAVSCLSQDSLLLSLSRLLLRPKADLVVAVSTGSIILKLQNTTQCLKHSNLTVLLLRSCNKDRQSLPSLLPKRVRQIQSRMMSIKQKLAQEPSYKMAYQRQVMSELKQERAIVQQLLQSGRTADAAVVQGRCKVMEAELTRAHKESELGYVCRVKNCSIAKNCVTKRYCVQWVGSRSEPLARVG